jgi:hypothetical protein
VSPFSVITAPTASQTASSALNQPILFRYSQSRTTLESLAASTTTLAKMSEYFDNFDFNALGPSNEEPFDFTFLDNMDVIGQDEVGGYDYNATFGFDSGMAVAYDPGFDFDFNAGFQPALPLPLPLLPDANAATLES